MPPTSAGRPVLRTSARRLRLALSALFATLHSTAAGSPVFAFREASSFDELSLAVSSVDELSFAVSSFDELSLAVERGISPINIAVAEIVFPRQLHVNEGTTLFIGSSMAPILSGNQITRLFFLHNESKLSLRGVTLAHGHCSECNGGAVFLSYRSMLLLRAVGIAHSRGFHGGAIYAEGSTIHAMGCTMTSNSAAWGGAVAVHAASAVSAMNCTMTSNSASFGGVVTIDAGSIFIAETCTMTSNTAVLNGGAVHAQGGSSVFATGCMIRSNSANFGGAIYANKLETVVTVTGCVISSNSAPFAGGAIHAGGDSIVTVTGCTMRSNLAESGGALSASGDSTIAATDSTMASNYAFWGGGLFAERFATVSATDCHFITNSASYGGAVFAIDSSSITTTDSTVTFNSASYGASFCVRGAAAVNMTSVMMSSNSAEFGAAIFAAGYSVVSTNGCTMVSNVARYLGGALSATGDSTIAATDCTMTSNVALIGGGAVYVTEVSSVISAGCTLSNNTSPTLGGALHTDGVDSMFVATNCTLSSNSAHMGGAVYAGAGSTISATDCTMSSNSAVAGGAAFTGALPSSHSDDDLPSKQQQSIILLTGCDINRNYADEQGGAMFIESAIRSKLPSITSIDNCRLFQNEAESGGALAVGRNVSQVHLKHSRFESNHATVIGGAVLVERHSRINILDSEFHANVDGIGTDDIGIVNLGGQLQCDATGCLQVCTECRDYPAPSVWPSSSPTPMAIVSLPPTALLPPTVRPPSRAQPITRRWWFVVGLGCLAAWCGVTFLCFGHRRKCRGFGLNSGAETALSRYQRALLDARSDEPEPGSELSVELVGHSVLKAYETSLAPVFVVGSTNMRIAMWSPGLAVAAPTHVDPVGLLLSDLPFVNASDGYRLHKSLGRIFDAPAEHDAAQTFALHLRTNKGVVLLEMQAHYLMTVCESIIVMTGRQVDPELACMMVCESSAVA